jgi:hypothetical protein
MSLTDALRPARSSVTTLTLTTLMVSVSLMLLAGAAPAQGSLSLYDMSLAPLKVSVNGDDGGNIAQYLIRTEEYREAQTQLSFSGRCDSACTLFLSLAPEQICIRQDAYFRFHAPVAKSQRARRAAETALMERYPDWVRDWIAMKGGLRRHLMTMDSAYASKFVQPCAELLVAGNP